MAEVLISEPGGSRKRAWRVVTPPRRRREDLRRRAGLFAAGGSILPALPGCGAAVLIIAVLGYNSPLQRDAVSAGLALQSAPALMIFAPYAAELVFDQDNIARISRTGSWLLAYATAPFLPRGLLSLFALFPGLSWLRVDGAAAVMTGLCLLLLARIIACGRDIEQQPDLYI